VVFRSGFLWILSVGLGLLLGFFFSFVGVVEFLDDDFFFGDDSATFEALDAESGKPLWHFNVGQDMTASPMTYALAGRQYVAVAVGSDIFSFALGQ